jgi:hypothetical protein
MPGEHQARRGDERPAIEQEAQSAAESGQDVSSDTLQQIVAETAASLARSDEADPALKAAMVEVARRYAGQPITVDPVGAALMEAVLRVQFPVVASRATLLARTARSVAASLLADPTARLRVEHLWATLGEDVA